MAQPSGFYSSAARAHNASPDDNGPTRCVPHLPPRPNVGSVARLAHVVRHTRRLRTASSLVQNGHHWLPRSAVLSRRLCPACLATCRERQVPCVRCAVSCCAFCWSLCTPWSPGPPRVPCRHTPPTRLSLPTTLTARARACWPPGVPPTSSPPPPAGATSPSRPQRITAVPTPSQSTSRAGAVPMP